MRTMLTTSRALTLAAGLLPAILSLAPASRADATAPLTDVPAIACVEPIKNAKVDYDDYRKGRLQLSKLFLRHQLWALEKLQEHTQRQIPEVRSLMDVARTSNSKAASQAALRSIGILLQSEFSRAAGNYHDRKMVSYDGLVWEVDMDTQVILKNGDYGVSACSVATSLYDDRIENRLRTCSLLDLETGTIWGRTLQEALEIAGNKMDEARFTAYELSRDFPMCLRWAGFEQISASFVSDVAEAIKYDHGWNKGAAEESYLAPAWGMGAHDAPYGQKLAE